MQRQLGTNGQYDVVELTRNCAKARRTAQEAIAIPTNRHLRESLSIGHDTESHTQEELEALQKVGEDAGPVTEHTESEIALEVKGVGQCAPWTQLTAVHLRSSARDISVNRAQ